MQYIINHSRWHHDYEVSVGNSSYYFIENSKMTLGKPDLTFYAGPNTTAPIIGSCRYHHFSTSTEISLGDPGHPHKIEVDREGIFSKRYTFRALAGQNHRTFTWKGTTQGSGRHNYKLVDDNTNQIVALFSSGSSFSRTDGLLDISVDFGPQFSLLTLMTFLAVHEKARRARAANGSGAGGAAGGAAGCGA